MDVCWLCSVILIFINVMLRPIRGSGSRTGQRLHSLHLQSLVESHVHGLGGLGDLQALHAASEGGFDGERSLTDAV